MHKHTRAWKTRLGSLCSLSSGFVCSLARLFESPCAVYALLQLDFSGRIQQGPSTVQVSAKTDYVGSTTNTIFSRQDARARKYRQLAQGQYVSCELALHWMLTHSKFHVMVVVPLLVADDPLSCRTLERFVSRSGVLPSTFRLF